LHQCEHVGAKVPAVRGVVARIADAAIDTSSDVFHERAEHAAIELADGEVAVQRQAGADHRRRAGISPTGAAA
jgi:hypothetical protein